MKTLLALLAAPLRVRLERNLCTTFGLIALFLAAIGIYAVLAYNVTRRRNEFGIRMALGAERGRITGMILKETGSIIVVGLITGVIGSGIRAAPRIILGNSPVARAVVTPVRSIGSRTQFTGNPDTTLAACF